MAKHMRRLRVSTALIGSLAITPPLIASGTLLAITVTTQTAQAGITKIVISRKISPAFDGRSFGDVGQYEQLDGIAYGEVDPEDRQNAIIQDIDLAPRNSNGKVEYSTDISILKPIDATKGNRVLLYDVVNRGQKTAAALFNVGATLDEGATGANPVGDGFLEKEGFTLVWSGWQADLVPSTNRIAMTAPVAHPKAGGTLTGLVRSEIGGVASPLGRFAALTQTSPILGGLSGGSRGYRPVGVDTTKATLTQRVHALDPREPIPATQWAFGSCNQTFPNVIPDPPDASQFHVCKAGGFDLDHIYELTYQAQDPVVLGLGFAATRDVVSYLRHSGDPQNPLADAVRHTMVFGASQSGRYLRGFL